MRKVRLHVISPVMLIIVFQVISALFGWIASIAAWFTVPEFRENPYGWFIFITPVGLSFIALRMWQELRSVGLVLASGTEVQARVLSFQTTSKGRWKCNLEYDLGAQQKVELKWNPTCLKLGPKFKFGTHAKLFVLPERSPGLFDALSSVLVLE